jgi:DivIVA domain-containing protein
MRVALDRQSIEKKDFPVGRRGYDPEAVDAHLNTLADEIADFKRSARRRSDTLASSASEQVRAIVEAAETSASDIQRDAENEARDIRDEANSEAKATREQAAEQAREYVGKVSESTASMLSRLDAMESEFTDMIDSLRTGANRLDADLRLLEGNLAEVGETIVPRPRFEPEPEPPAVEAPAEEPSAQAAEPETVVAAVETEVETVGTENGAGATEAEGALAGAPDGYDAADAGAASQAEGADDAEGARLIALNMALNGTPREETAKYLSENFQLSDRDGLLDEVYASVEG